MQIEINKDTPPKSSSKSQHEVAQAAETAPPGEGANAQAKKPKHPATQKQKIILSVFLLILTAGSLFMIYHTIDRINQESLAEVSTPWILPDGMTLKDGPPGFYYEAAEGKLIHSGPVTTARKLILRDLLEPAGAKPPTTRPQGAGQANDATGPLQEHLSPKAGAEPPGKTPAANPEKVLKSYNQAIDKLAYLSSIRQSEVIQLMLLLGLFGGALGAILRSLVDFVGHACYTDQLDFLAWWPLYLTRPVVGAILGFILIVLFKAKLLVVGEAQAGDDSFWWLGVAVLGGFSTVDVTLRLRVAAKALFGGGSGEK